MKKLYQCLAALLLGILLTNQHVLAQANNYPSIYGNPATPQIAAFSVDEVRQLRPGVELEFNLYGTPGGNATLRIAGAMRNLNLIEVESGQYEGTYTITSRDRIAARSAVTANLRVGNQVSSTVLNESLQIGVGYHPTYHPSKRIAQTQPSIRSFTFEPTATISSGDDLRFMLSGTAGGKVELQIDGVRGKVYLPEVSSGEYASTYTIRSRDRIKRNARVIANLRVGDAATERSLALVLQSNPLPVSTSPTCRNCGIVEAVNQIDVKGDGKYLGTIGGGVVGLLLGSQIGGGSGRTAAQIAGAVGGAYAGRAIEGKMNVGHHYEVTIRLEHGGQQIFSFSNDPGYHVGERVRIINGGIQKM